MYYIKRNNDLNIFDEMANFFNEGFRGPVKHMKTDLVENENEFIFDIDMPGFDKKDINIEVNEGYLVISANVEEVKEDNTKYIRKERMTKSISRSYFVGEIDLEKIKAKFENGVLNVVVPKVKEEVVEKKFIKIE